MIGKWGSGKQTLEEKKKGHTYVTLECPGTKKVTAWRVSAVADRKTDSKEITWQQMQQHTVTQRYVLLVLFFPSHPINWMGFFPFLCWMQNPPECSAYLKLMSLLHMTAEHSGVSVWGSACCLSLRWKGSHVLIRCDSLMHWERFECYSPGWR